MAFEDKDETCRDAVSRLSGLIEEIAARDWKGEDAIEEITKLQQINPEYAGALRCFSPSIFLTRYPDVFSKRMWHFPDPL